jgi:pre-mRNA-processing factor 39
VRTKGRFSSETSRYLSQHYMEYLLNRGGKDAAEEYMVLDREVNGYVSSAKSDPSQSLPSKQKK